MRPASWLRCSGVDQPPQRVEVIVPVRTLLALLAFGSLVALALLSIGTLLSIFVAAVLALGPRPGGRGARAPRLGARPRGARCSPRCSPPCSRIVLRHRGAAVGPDHRLRRRAAGVLGRPDAHARLPAPDVYGRHRGHRPHALKDLANGLPDAATRCSASPAACSARCSRSSRSRSCALPADGAPDDHRLAVRLRHARGRAALAAGARGLDQRGLLLADRQRRDLARGGDGGRRSRRGRSGCRSRSCSP